MHFTSDPTKPHPGNSSWLLQVNASSRPIVTVFCFPYAGGGASMFRHWIGHFPPDIEILAVQLPGREGRIGESAITRMAPLVKAVSEGLLPHLQGRFVFLGHSMGAILAFEVARHLHRMGRVGPELLIASASPAPQLPRRQSATYLLPDADLFAKLHSLGGTPPGVFENPDLMDLSLGAIRADFEAIETYEYEPGGPLSCPIIAIGGSDDPDVGCEDLDAWRVQTAAEFSMAEFSGNHFFLFDAPASSYVHMIRFKAIQTQKCAH